MNSVVFWVDIVLAAANVPLVVVHFNRRCYGMSLLSTSAVCLCAAGAFFAALHAP